MSDVQSRLDKIRQRITSQEFLKGRGLGNDVPFYAFDYPTLARIIHQRWSEGLAGVV